MDASAPKDVRRRALEGSVRGPQTWHRDAIRAAFASADDAWKLTAVFCMRFVMGFDDQALEALNSTNPAIHYEAVVAAGNWGVTPPGRTLPTCSHQSGRRSRCCWR